MKSPINMSNFKIHSISPGRLLSSTLPALAFVVSCVVATSAFAADALVGNAENAKASKVSMCIGCHGIPGYRASFPEVYSVPMIAGQNPTPPANVPIPRWTRSLKACRIRILLICRLITPT